MNITVIGRNPANAYSGGRYYAWILAEAIAKNHNLIYFTNACPMFSNDFSSYESHKKIDLRLIDDKFNDLNCEEDIDIIFFIPGMDNDNSFYKNTLKFAQRKNAHLVLINFESPNWFNKYSVIQRDEKLWDNWLMMSQFASCILSISKEGDFYAKDFYNNVPDSAIFDYCYPAINSKVADRIYSDCSIAKENRIIMTARFSLSDHKGSYNIPHLFCEEMRGYTFVLILGAGDVPKNIKREIEERASQYGVSIEYKHTLSDQKKFIEFKRAKLLLFPSFFEGYGYPPVEAQYLNTACVAFRIPVLEETSPNIDFAVLGDWEQFKAKIGNVLIREEREYREGISEIASFDSMVKKINLVISKLADNPVPSELKDMSSINVSSGGSIGDRSPNSAKTLFRRLVGFESYILVRQDYHSYRCGTFGIATFSLKLFSNLIVKKLVSKETHSKILEIYKIIKG
ncbi:glycosyltransferase [Vibrio barjaei]|uniref:Glycosyltransferase n=1 Tax=Vibrio barjaei TaxID=1676683 RepID=A0ABW7IEI0_9VIBR